MPWYNDLRPETDDHKQSFGQLFPKLTNEDRVRIIENILILRKQLKEEINTKETDRTLLIATWNLKEFGHYAKRLPEAYYYVAEILNRFDLIAVQEIKTSLTDLQIVMRLLGSEWSYMVNDITGGTAGNKESFAYIFNKQRVVPSGLAGEIVLWDEISQNLSIKQLMRTPYITGFKAGWKDFAIINVHLKPNNTDTTNTIRKDEILALVTIIEERLKTKTMWTENLMIMGDFNMYHDNADIMKILGDKGFKQLVSLVGKNTNISNTEAYDKIYYLENKYFTLAVPDGEKAGDVFDFFKSVFRMGADDDFLKYKKVMAEQKEDPSTLINDDEYEKYFKNHWRIRQMSDHLPVWISMEIDSSEDFLKEKLQENLDDLII